MLPEIVNFLILKMTTFLAKKKKINFYLLFFCLIILSLPSIQNGLGFSKSEKQFVFFAMVIIVIQIRSSLGQIFY